MGYGGIGDLSPAFVFIIIGGIAWHDLTHARQNLTVAEAGEGGAGGCGYFLDEGQSTVAAAKAVHRAYTRAGSTVLVASPSERQSAEFFAEGGGDGAKASDSSTR